MPDPNITLAVIQTHAIALERTIGRPVANAARCKLWSGAIVGGILLLASGKAQMAALPWAVVVVVLLAVVDAGQVAMARVFTDAYNRFMRKLPVNGGNAMKAEEFVLPAPELGLQHAWQVLGALASFSVWPFYGALLALLVAFHVQNSPDSGKRAPDSGKGMTESGTKHSAGCSAGGGCGPSGGCGSGGCGASAGKACGCGGGGAAKAASPANKTSQPGNGISPTAIGMPQSGNGNLQSVNGIAKSGTPVLQSRQTPALSPLKPGQQQPGVRLPVAPLTLTRPVQTVPSHAPNPSALPNPPVVPRTGTPALPAPPPSEAIPPVPEVPSVAR